MSRKHSLSMKTSTELRRKEVITKNLRGKSVKDNLINILPPRRQFRRHQRNRDRLLRNLSRELPCPRGLR